MIAFLALPIRRERPSSNVAQPRGPIALEILVAVVVRLATAQEARIVVVVILKAPSA